MFGKRVECLHVHDNHRVFDHDEHLIPFDGTVDFESVAADIRESGFAGTVMLEIIPRNYPGFYDALSVEEYLHKAALAAKKLVAMIDGE